MLIFKPEVNEMNIEDIFESIHVEWQFECLETGNYAGDMEQLDEFVIEEVFENWGLKLWQKKAIVKEFDLDHTVLHMFYIIKGGKYESWD